MKYTVGTISRILQAIGLLIAIALFLFGYAKNVMGTSQSIEIPDDQSRLIAVVAPLIPPQEAFIRPVSNDKVVSATNSHRIGFDCVTTLKRAGLLPAGQVTTNGFAGSIPTKPLKLKDGQKAVIVTYEGKVGHALEVQKKGDNYVSIVEGNFPGGVGRIVPPSVIKGQVAL